MTSLQISMTEKQLTYAKDLLIKARASFENNGDRYSFAKAIIRVLEEWSENKGFIKNTVQGKKEVTARNLILNDFVEMEYINGVIDSALSTPNPTNLRILGEYIRRVDSTWKTPKGNGASSLFIERAKELFRSDEFTEMSLEEAVALIKELDPDWDWKHQRGAVVRDYAKKLRGSK